MSRKERATFIAAIASTVTSVVFQISTVIGSDWIRLHLSKYVLPGWALSAALGLLWLWLRTREADVPPTHQERDTSPVATAQGAGNITVSPNITVAPVITAHSPPHRESDRNWISLEPAKPRPPLTAQGDWTSLVYDDRQGRWRQSFSDPGAKQPSFIVWFRNPLPADDEQGGPTPLLFAYLEMDSGGLKGPDVTRAYWLNQTVNVQSIPIGQKAGVVVGYSESAFWMVHENRTDTLSDGNVLPSSWPIGERHKYPAIMVPLITTISLVDAVSGKVIAKKRFQILDEAREISGLEMSDIPSWDR